MTHGWVRQEDLTLDRVRKVKHAKAGLDGAGPRSAVREEEFTPAERDVESREGFWAGSGEEGGDGNEEACRMGFPAEIL